MGFEILKKLFDENVVSVLQVFVEHPSQHFSLTQVADLSNVKISTVQRIITKLVERGFVSLVLIGKSKVYQLNTESEIKVLLSLFENRVV